jgi:hypothetical protein
MHGGEGLQVVYKSDVYSRALVATLQGSHVASDQSGTALCFRQRFRITSGTQWCSYRI